MRLCMYAYVCTTCEKAVMIYICTVEEEEFFRKIRFSEPRFKMIKSLAPRCDINQQENIIRIPQGFGSLVHLQVIFEFCEFVGWI